MRYLIFGLDTDGNINSFYGYSKPDMPIADGWKAATKKAPDPLMFGASYDGIVGDKTKAGTRSFYVPIK